MFRKSNKAKSIENFLPADKQTVVVELFTSQGCSSCPPADRVLSILNKTQPVAGADIVTLSLHVDYWDSPSWKDEFSHLDVQQAAGHLFGAVRGENYTPQMVVDGANPFVGSNMKQAQKLISDAAKAPKAKIELVQNQDKLKIKITDAPAHENATIFLAIAEDDLSSGVRGGENSGRELAHTSGRSRTEVAWNVDRRTNESRNGNCRQLQPKWKKGNLSLVVFLQENQKRRIFGAAKRKRNNAHQRASYLIKFSRHSSSQPSGRIENAPSKIIAVSGGRRSR
jgi:hypothetical protein